MPTSTSELNNDQLNVFLLLYSQKQSPHKSLEEYCLRDVQPPAGFGGMTKSFVEVSAMETTEVCMPSDMAVVLTNTLAICCLQFLTD